MIRPHLQPRHLQLRREADVSLSSPTPGLRSFSVVAVGAVLLLISMLAAPVLAADNDDSAKPTAPTTTPAATPAPAPSADQSAGFSIREVNQAALTAAVKQLILEAQDIDKLEGIKSPATFKRPHPVLSNWGPAMSVDVLTRMLQPFTGNDYRDTYIRWHLMHVVKMMAPEDRAEVGKRLVRLIKMLPPVIDVPRQDESTVEPADLAAESRQLWNSTHRVVGYGVFARDYWGADSLPFVTGPEKARIEAALARIAEIKPQLKHTRYPAAAAFNSRVRQMNWLIRQYRGEVIYVMLQTGDPAMIKLVLSEIEQQLRQQQRTGFDLMAFVYTALFDGVLDQYDRAALVDMGNELKRIASQNEGYKIYMMGDKPPANNMPNRVRNFADYALHMVNTLKEFETVSGDLMGTQTQNEGPTNN